MGTEAGAILAMWSRLFYKAIDRLASIGRVIV